MKLTDADVQEIIRLLDESAYDEIEIETERFRLVLRRADGGGWVQQRQTLAQPNRVDPSAAETSASGQSQLAGGEIGRASCRERV